MNPKLLLAVGLGCGGAIVLFVACAGFLGFAFYSTSSAQGEVSTAVDRLMQAANDGSFAQTYTSATTPEFRQVTSAADYARLGETIKTQLGALRSKQVMQIHVRRATAHSFADVAYQAKFERGEGTIRATLKRSGSQWLLQALNVNSPALLGDLPSETCRKCGGKYAASARFCPHCGEKVAAER
ncbi:MAG TPA: hypothetical protein VFW87_09675 [Pirellulales bacterium]|nr:hypothetical protein [Pirellulales bacterium]